MIQTKQVDSDRPSECNPEYDCCWEVQWVMRLTLVERDPGPIWYSLPALYAQVQLLRFNICWLVKDLQMCPLFKICLVAPFLSRGAVIYNQKWTLRKTNNVSEPLCPHYRNDVTHGQQEPGTLTLFFYKKKVLCVHPQLWHSSYDLTTARSLKPTYTCAVQ